MSEIDIGNQYIHAEPYGDMNGKPAYTIVNKKGHSEIACVCYYPTWQRYVMVTTWDAIFDTGCLKSISDFIDLQNGVKG